MADKAKLTGYTDKDVQERGLQVDFDPNRKTETPFVIPSKPFPKPMNMVDKAAQDDEKKKKLKKADQEKIMKKLEKFTEQLKQIGLKDDDSDSEDETKLIETVEMSEMSNEVGLPQIGSIEHPMYVGTENAFNVTVGSRAWLHTYDELRATRWSQKFLDEWMKRSADIVKNDALYDVIDTDGVNHIEEFSMGYPDASRQNERLDVGFAKLIRDIRLQSRSDPFVKAMGPDGKETCPPKFDFQFRGGVRMENFLRHWTSFKKMSPMYDVVGDTAQEVFECSPPANMKYSWVPLEWRKEIEEAYNLTKFNYLDPVDFKSYIVTLTKPEGLNDRYREVDTLGNGRPHITVNLANGGAARVYLGQVKLNFTPCPTREGVKPEELTLREWCDLMQTQEDFYPLISVLLNVRAPDSDGTPKDPYAYSRYIYNHIADKNGQKRRRMYADAPLRLFQQQMIKRYAGARAPGIKWFEVIY
jgi:hypothetical protein